MEETGRIIERVSGLVEEAAPDAEHALMDGYARVLALEADRTRLERRFTEVARSLADTADPAQVAELAALKERISGTVEELEHLRCELGVFRRRLAAGEAAATAEAS